MSEEDTPEKEPAQDIKTAVGLVKTQLQGRLKDTIFKWPVFVVFCALGAFVLAGIFKEFIGSENYWRVPYFWYAIVPIGAALGGVIYFFTFGYSRLVLTDLIADQDKFLTGNRIVQLQETLEEDFFNKLVKINFKYLDQYYLQTHSQAEKSFRLSAIVAAVALLIIIAGIALMYVGKTEPAYVTTASGVLGEFIAAVFFYLYNRTIMKMSEYHQKLVITQNISLALKIAEGLPEQERVQAQKELIQRLSQDCNKYLTEFRSNDANEAMY